MKRKLHALYQTLKLQGLTPGQEKKICYELDLLEFACVHDVPRKPGTKSIYSYNDLEMLQNSPLTNLIALNTVQSLDYLLERDKQREKDGFPRKIRVGKMVKPSQDGEDKIVIVPTTVEEKLFHDKAGMS